MLTPSDFRKIENFESLSIGHQRVFRHRLIKKFRDFQRDLHLVLQNFERLEIKADKIVDIIQVIKILELYEDLSKLQNM